MRLSSKCFTYINNVMFIGDFPTNRSKRSETQGKSMLLADGRVTLGTGGFLINLMTREGDKRLGHSVRERTRS